MNFESIFGKLSLRAENPTRGRGSRGRGNGRGRGQGRGRGGSRRGYMHGARGHGGEDVRRRDRPIGYMHLIELSELNDVDELIVRLAASKESFQLLLNSPSMKEDWSYALLKIFHKISEAKRSQSKVSMMALLRESMFISSGLTRSMIMWEMTASVEEKTFIVKSMIGIIDVFFKLFPSSCTDMPLDHLVHFMTKLPGRDEELRLKVNFLVKERNEIVQKITRKEEKPNRGQFNFTNDPPPDDFREIPTVPDVNDIHREEKPYLRPIKAKGCYDDGEHYLDVQFRLLREDLVAPLREGVMEIIEEIPRKDRKHALKVYNRVQVLYPRCSKSGIIHRIRFDTTDTKDLPWKHSKRLIFGSLLCFSKDEFQTIIFATVADRNPLDLQKGELDVRFVGVLEVEVYFQNGEQMQMVESSTYFEAYKHVLDGMKDFDADSLPMHKYIVSCHSEVEAPSYISRERFYYSSSYNLQTALKSKDAKTVSILKDESWPCYQDTDLNDSQLKAFKHALTKEFVVIQGPPGTGKTHVGIRIADALLVNKKYWNSVGKTPMLIVCYTNHALDQFLTGIIEFGHTNVIRVGGRASEEMQRYSLRNALVRQRGINRNRGIDNDEFRYLRRAKAKSLEARENFIRQHDTMTEGMINAQRKLSDGTLVTFNMLKQFMKEEHTVYFEAYDARCRELKMSIFDVYLQLNHVPPESIMHLQLRERMDEEENVVNEEEKTDETAEGVDIDGEGQVLVERWAADTNEFKVISFEKKAREEVVVARNENFLVDKDGFQYVQPKRWQKKKRIHKALISYDIMLGNEANAVTDPWNLSLTDRWRLYKYWLQSQADHCRTRCAAVAVDLEEVCEQIKELQHQEDQIAFQKADVIAMTTTCAARYRRALQKIAPKVVIIEEAAEVLEAHVITSLSSGTEHLILIGDHQQLKPNPSVFELATKYSLEVSLFQRMVENGMDCHTLEVQHRMRPEISYFLRHIYPKLRDHESVSLHPSIKGVNKNVIFINHQEKEYEMKHMRSKANLHEAEFMKSLCFYFLQQGYKPSQITIITGYTGQLMQFKRIMPRDVFEGVRVTAVDNFQGEENDIILLSLVRSNDSGNIGFLKTDNRICVALSRAKHGLFIIGNFNILAKSSKLWSKIISDAIHKGCFGASIQLSCQNHPAMKIHARRPDDFKNAPEGGCTKPCEFRLDCGHVCEKACHPKDPMHLEYKCRKLCRKVVCSKEHRCEKQCHYESSCGVCRTPVKKIVPTCDHIQTMQCYENPARFQCKAPCVKLLECGHRCTQLCKDVCRKDRCNVMVQKILNCGHVKSVACSRDVKMVMCDTPCNVKLDCEHDCNGTCGGCKQNRLHEKCTKKCGRTLICSHQCEESCTKNCPPCLKTCENRCYHSKCKKKCGSLCAPCMEKCNWRCRHKICTKLCSELCDRRPCNMTCRQLLKCGHGCIGLCGEICPKECRICDKEKVEEIFFGDEDEVNARFIALEDCTHIFEVNGLDRWMKQDNGDENNVKMKECPRCKTIIRKSVRYGNIVKKTLKDINEIKQKILLNGRIDLEDIKNEAYAKCREINNLYVRKPSRMLETCTTASMFYRQITYGISKSSSENNAAVLAERLVLNSIGFEAVNSILHQAKLLEALLLLLKEVAEKLKEEAKDIIVSKDIVDVKKFIMKERLNEQQLRDVSDDLERTRVYINVLACKKELQKKMEMVGGLTGTAETQARHKLWLDRASRYMLKISMMRTDFLIGKKIEKSKMEEYSIAVNEIKKKFALDGISKQEKIMIINAIGLGKGHWFKCPNGHFYAIGDCGGANQKSECPECGAVIGGVNHALAPGNQHAREFDGSSFAAYSEEANNMLNLDPQQMRQLRL